jgi:hypothetical protein
MLVIEDIKTVDTAIDLLGQMAGHDIKSGSEILSK